MQSGQCGGCPLTVALFCLDRIMYAYAIPACKDTAALLVHNDTPYTVYTAAFFLQEGSLALPKKIHYTILPTAETPINRMDE
jgi:hypothetical protein